MGICGNSSRKEQRKRSEEINIDSENVLNEKIPSHQHENSPGKEKDLPLTHDEERSRTDVVVKSEVCRIHASEKDVEKAEEYLQQFLIQLTGRSDSTVYDMIRTYGVFVTFETGQSVLLKDSENKSIFIILQGQADVFTSNNEILLRTLGRGDVFGEISAIFGIPCTANVVTRTQNEVVRLQKGAVDMLFSELPVSLDLTDLCIRRRYLPTSDTLDSGRVYRRTVFQALRKLPIFFNWRDDVLKVLILTFDDAYVTLYPSNSYLLLDGDPLETLFIVIDGDLQIQQGTYVTSVSIHPGSEPFVYGHQGLLLDGQYSSYSLKVLSNAQVIQVRRCWFESTLEEHSKLKPEMQERRKEFERFLDNSQRVGHACEKAIQFDMLCRILSTSEKYKTTELDVIEQKVISSVFETLIKNEDLLTYEDRKIESVIVIRGEIKEVLGKDVDFSGCLVNQKVMLPNDGSVEEEGDVQDIGGKEVGEATKKHIRDLKTYSEGEVIDLDAEIMSSVVIVAASECLVMKVIKDGEVVSEASSDDVLDDLRLV